MADTEETKIVEKEEEAKEQVPLLGSAPAVVNEEEDGDDINSEAVVVKSAPVEEQFEEQQEEEQVIAHQGSLVKEENVAVELETNIDHQKIDDAVYEEESLSSAAIEEKEGEGLDATAVGEKEIENLSGIEQPEDHDSLQLDSAAGHESQSFEDEETNDEAVVEDEEEDDASRRARIAERLAQSGGINPLAAGASFASRPLPVPGPMRKRSVDVETPSRKGSLNIGSPLSRKTSVDIDESSPVRKTSSDTHEVSKEDIVEEADDKGDS
jgi:hypothetical protein